MLIAVYAAFSNLHMLAQRRKQFELDFALQHTLANEATAMHELAQREIAHVQGALLTII